MNSPTVMTTSAKENDLRGDRGESHVLTDSEQGFAPLDTHARRYGIDCDQVRAFADAVNERSVSGSMRPMTPISAVPRVMVRDRRDVDVLAESVAGFLPIYSETVEVRRLIFDFRLQR